METRPQQENQQLGICPTVSKKKKKVIYQSIKKKKVIYQLYVLFNARSLNLRGCRVLFVASIWGMPIRFNGLAGTFLQDSVNLFYADQKHQLIPCRLNNARMTRTEPSHSHCCHQDRSHDDSAFLLSIYILVLARLTYYFIICTELRFNYPFNR